MKTTTQPAPNTFNVTRFNEGNPLVSITISQECDLSEVIEAFESFLVAVGYSLPDGAHLGYEYEDENN